MKRFIAVAVSVLILAALFFLSSFLKYDEVPVQLSVSDVVGFNVGTDALYFGSVPPGSSAHRVIHVKNDRFAFGRANIKAFGDAARWLSVSDNNFYLRRDEVRDVEVKVDIPRGLDYGDYNGTLRVYFFPV